MFIKLTDPDGDGYTFLNMNLVEAMFWSSKHKRTKLATANISEERGCYMCAEKPEEIMQLIKEAQRCSLN